MRTLQLNGIDYAVAEAGAGRPLLLLHGFTGSSAAWHAVIPDLALGHHLIMPDLLGHGRTAAPTNPDRYAMDAAAADLAALLEELDVAQADVAGYSMGGRLALYFALSYPERVRRLVLESASPGLATAAERQGRRQQDEALAARIEREGIERFVDFWEGLPLWRSQEQLDEAVRARVRALRLANRPQGLAHSLRGMGTGVQPSLWQELKQVTQPVLLLVGQLDEKFVVINERMAAELPHGELALVAGAGHTVHLERPQVYVERVRGFVG